MKNFFDKYIAPLLKLPEVIFIIIAFIFGSAFLFITPAGCVPDEPCHIYRSCDVATGHLKSSERPVYKPYDNTFEKILSYRFNNDTQHIAMRYSPVMYFASAAGIKIGHKILNDELSIFYLGRFFNLIFYIMMFAAAIRITPVFKWGFLTAGLLPMSLFEGMSYSADSFSIAFSFLYFAYVFKLIFSEKEVSGRALVILTIFTVIACISKGLIYPLFLYFFIPIKKHKPLILSGITILAVLLFTYSSSNLNYINLNHTCEVLNDKLYLFHEPLRTIKAILITIREKGYIYIQQMIGYLGWLSIPIPVTICNRVIFLFILMFFVLHEKIKINIRIIAGFVVLFFYLFILYMELITWTPVNKILIEGVQGRYFIPLLPMLMLAFPSFELKISDRYKDFFKILLLFSIINVLYISVIAVDTYFYRLGINKFM